MVCHRLLNETVPGAAFGIALKLPVPLLRVERREPNAQLLEFRSGKLGDLLLKALEPGHLARLAPHHDVVMLGLDPRIHSVAFEFGFAVTGMDCGIKSGNDDRTKGFSRCPATSR